MHTITITPDHLQIYADVLEQLDVTSRHDEPALTIICGHHPELGRLIMAQDPFTAVIVSEVELINYQETAA